MATAKEYIKLGYPASQPSKMTGAGGKKIKVEGKKGGSKIKVEKKKGMN